MDSKTRTYATIGVLLAILLCAVAIFLVLNTDSNDNSERIDYKSDVVIKDYLGRDVAVPTNLNGGIITDGRLSTLRWLAYFPNAMEKVVMVDVAMTRTNSGALAYSYAYADVLGNCDKHSNDSLDDASRMNFKNASLILINDSTYKTAPERCETLAKTNPVAIIDMMADIEGTRFWDDNYKVCDRFVNQARLYGKLLGEEERAEEVIGLFQKHIDAIRSFVKDNGESDDIVYVGGTTNRGSNQLSTTYSPYLPLSLVSGKNALDIANTDGKYDKNGRYDLPPSVVNTELKFNTLAIDPASLSIINENNSQMILKSINGRNSDGDQNNDVRICNLIPMISHGGNWTCVLCSAYHFIHVLYGDSVLTVQQVKDKCKEVFTDFYGERGTNVFDKMSAQFTKIGENYGSGLCSTPFAELKVSESGGKYIVKEA